jgi:hypothetical protein
MPELHKYCIYYFIRTQNSFISSSFIKWSLATAVIIVVCYFFMLMHALLEFCDAHMESFYLEKNPLLDRLKSSIKGKNATDKSAGSRCLAATHITLKRTQYVDMNTKSNKER